MNANKHTSIKPAFIEIARMDKDIDFECICDECSEDCANYNWKQNNEEPPMPYIIEECIWDDTYDNLYDLYIANDDTIDTRIKNYYKNLEQLKIKLAFQWGKFCEMRERTELSTEQDCNYVYEIIKTFHKNWRGSTKNPLKEFDNFFGYDGSVYNNSDYDYYDVDQFICNYHPIFIEIGKLLGRVVQ